MRALVVGSRVHQSLGGRLLGGVTGKVVEMTRYPIVVVPWGYQVAER